jgi:hypothetical protein
MPIGDEDYSTNLEALGRFKPGYVAGAEGETGELDVLLSTNLSGEPIRFTFNESLDNIVSNGTLTMLNAIIGDEGEQQVGVMGEVKTEEDEAKWGTLYDSAPIEPNQLVTVTESGGGLGECTTYWRVVGVTSYLDENDIPYYEVQLEGMGQVAIETKFDAKKLGSPLEEVFFIKGEYWDSLRAEFQVDADNDGYVTEEISTNANLETQQIFNGARYITESPSDFLIPFLEQIAENGLDCGAGIVPNLKWVPCSRIVQSGESCWQIVEDILGFSGYIARFTRDKKMVFIDLLGGQSGEVEWSGMPSTVEDDGTAIYEEDYEQPLEDTDIGDFGKGLQLGYSKEGVFSKALVYGKVAEKNEDGIWEIGPKNEDPITIISQAGMNILNGQTVETTVQVDENYLLEDEEMLELFGEKELYKSVIGARSAVYNSESVPLAVEVGMTITGSSKLGGTTSIFITALNRTTDAQQNKITTGLSGTRVPSESGSTTNTLGWE